MRIDAVQFIYCANEPPFKLPSILNGSSRCLSQMRGEGKSHRKEEFLPI